MIDAVRSGVTLTLPGTGPKERDPALSGATREATLAAMTTGTPTKSAIEHAGLVRVANRARHPGE